MIKLTQALSDDLLLQLVRSTLNGIATKDCFYNQLHYINRGFIDANFAQLTSIMAEGLADLHPGISADDIAYVNDFVAPVNLVDSAVRNVHPSNRGNKYQWHIDTIDQWFGPCYNLWIPLYRQQALAQLDDRSLFNVMDPEGLDELYDADGLPRTDQLADGANRPPGYLNIVEEFSGIDIDSLRQSFVYYDAKGKIGVLPKDQIYTQSVRRPDLGDAFIFQSNQFHASGPSKFERVGISIKFIVSNPQLGFKEYDSFRHPAPMQGWEGVFTGCYAQFKDFTSFRKYLPECIANEQNMLHKNQHKLDNIASVLTDIESEMAITHFVTP